MRLNRRSPFTSIGPADLLVVEDPLHAVDRLIDLHMLKRLLHLAEQ